MTDFNGGSIKAEHLCVLVHGLWGNPSHMESIAKSLRNQFSEDKVYILVTKKNSGYHTYDGIETCGERVCLEVEEEIEAIRARGGSVKKLSVVGYSLGGLIARYAIGLLYAKGTLDKLECMNFTAFASPFLGVRSPTKGWANRVWNGFGARLLSMSGRQLFLVDQFRDSKRPILAVLADPESIFMQGLALFRRRTLYANITNDRSAVYYTTGITKTDPYTDLTKLKVRYVKGYEDVILDPTAPFAPRAKDEVEPRTVSSAVRGFANRVPLAFALVVFVPIGLTFFLLTSGYQTVQSARRRQLHESNGGASRYRLPLWMKQVQERVDDAYENLNSTHDQEFLVGESGSSDSDEAESEAQAQAQVQRQIREEEEEEAGAGVGARAGVDAATATARRHSRILASERRMSVSSQPTLALAPEQFEMIQSLDKLGWRKYPVWIHKVRHSHAAIIVRWETDRFSEGRTVLKHWLKEEFLA